MKQLGNRGSWTGHLGVGRVVRRDRPGWVGALGHVGTCASLETGLRALGPPASGVARRGLKTPRRRTAALRLRGGWEGRWEVVV